MLEQFYPTLKALHIISMVAWMAGLFYLPRIFVYHVEKGYKKEITHVFNIMERKLYNYIMVPSMLSTWIFGVLLVFGGGFFSLGTDYWLYLKTILVLLLTWYNMWCGKMVKTFERGDNKHTGKYFRVMNEVPTIVLILIVFLVVLKPF